MSFRSQVVLNLFFAAILIHPSLSNTAAADADFTDKDGVTPCDRYMEIKSNFHGKCTATVRDSRGRVKVSTLVRKDLTCAQAGAVQDRVVSIRDISGATTALPNGELKCQNVGGMTSVAMTEQAAGKIKADKALIKAGKPSKLCPEGGSPILCFMEDPADKKKDIYLHSAKKDGTGKGQVLVDCNSAVAHLWYRCEEATSAPAPAESDICFNTSSGLNGLCLAHVAPPAASPSPTATPITLVEDSLCEVVLLAYDQGGMDAVTQLLENPQAHETLSLMSHCTANTKLENSYVSVEAEETVVIIEPTATAVPTASRTSSPVATPKSTPHATPQATATARATL